LRELAFADAVDRRRCTFTQRPLRVPGLRLCTDRRTLHRSSPYRRSQRDRPCPRGRPSEPRRSCHPCVLFIAFCYDLVELDHSWAHDVPNALQESQVRLGLRDSTFSNVNEGSSSHSLPRTGPAEGLRRSGVSLVAVSPESCS
jgi:hypothetical protein